jgi:hypothetical protein
MLSQATIYQNSIRNNYSLQVIVKVLNVDDTTTVNTNNDNRGINGRISNHIYFLICNSCFWCASLFSDLKTIKCPECNSSGNLESIPISQNESFKINYDSKIGTVLEFSCK